MTDAPAVSLDQPHFTAPRTAAGAWLKAKRQERSLTPQDVAKALGLNYATSVTQMEVGHARVPPDRVKAYAAILGVPMGEFVRNTDPTAWGLHRAILEDEKASR